MTTRVERIKKHFRNNKKLYVGAGLGFTAGSIGATIFFAKQNNIQIVDSFKILEWKTTKLNQTILEMPARGHRGNVVLCNETGTLFASQGEAAKAMGLNPSRLSQHLNGQRDHISGHTFQRLGENLTEEVKLAV